MADNHAYVHCRKSLSALQRGKLPVVTGIQQVVTPFKCLIVLVGIYDVDKAFGDDTAVVMAVAFVGSVGEVVEHAEFQADSGVIFH